MYPGGLRLSLAPHMGSAFSIEGFVNSSTPQERAHRLTP